jgi:hypothetical protein
MPRLQERSQVFGGMRFIKNTNCKSFQNEEDKKLTFRVPVRYRETNNGAEKAARRFYLFCRRVAEK